MVRQEVFSFLSRLITTRTSLVYENCHPKSSPWSAKSHM
jgi:hypothetical protein